MQHLPLPVSAVDDEAVIEALGKTGTWSSHEADWIAAYRRYQKHGGDPFKVTAHDFGEGIADLQYRLYDTRKGSGELARMRRKRGLKSCPVCGSPVTGDLDHYLPRDVYPEFSIMRANLVPACRHCNSGVKGTKVHDGEPRRFIHPYFDAWANDDLWEVEVVPPYRAATFKPRPTDGLGSSRRETVAFHLKNVLGTQFHLSMENEWSDLPMHMRMRGATMNVDGVETYLAQELRVAVQGRGRNSWTAALIRGVRSNEAAKLHIVNAAEATVLPPG